MFPAFSSSFQTHMLYSSQLSKAFAILSHGTARQAEGQQMKSEACDHLLHANLLHHHDSHIGFYQKM